MDVPNYELRPELRIITICRFSTRKVTGEIGVKLRQPAKRDVKIPINVKRPDTMSSLFT